VVIHGFTRLAKKGDKAAARRAQSILDKMEKNYLSVKSDPPDCLALAIPSTSSLDARFFKCRRGTNVIDRDCFTPSNRKKEWGLLEANPFVREHPTTRTKVT